MARSIYCGVFGVYSVILRVQLSGDIYVSIYVAHWSSTMWREREGKGLDMTLCLII